MKRGEVWWASLPPASGSGPGYRRPVLVIQANAFNQSRISTVLVAVITSNLSLANAPGNVRVSKTDSGLSKPSVVNVSQVLTVDKSVLTKKAKALPGKILARNKRSARGLRSGNLQTDIPVLQCMQYSQILRQGRGDKEQVSSKPGSYSCFISIRLPEKSLRK